MRAIIRWNLWQKRWFIMWWLIAIFAFIAINLAFYPSFRDQAAQFDKTFTQNIPEGARAFISDTQDFLSPVGYLSSQIFYLMLPMLLGILAISLGSSLIAREEKEGTLELLMSRPISRSSLLLAKAVTGMIILSGAALLAFITTAIGVKLVKLPLDIKHIALATFVCFLLSVSFGAIAYMITTLGKARSASIGLTTVIALGGYIVSSLSVVATWLMGPAYFVPFNYYHPAEILNGSYSFAEPLVFIGILLAAGLIAWVAFRKRDIE